MNNEIKKACLKAVDYLRQQAPKDTGNLAYNSVQYESTENAFIIYIDESIAPYMPYTNEPWLSPRWNGKKNPNEAWFQKTAEGIVTLISNILDGKVVEK